jgi:hypothetical protein
VKGSEAEATLIARVQLAAGGERGDWWAAAWLLERMHPNRYGQHQRHQVEHSGGVRAEVVEIPNDRERMNEVSAILRAAGVLGCDLQR